GAAAADERDVVVDVEREVPALLQRIHVDPVAGLQRLGGPAAEGGAGDREALPHEQVVDPDDQLGGAVAHGDGLRVESHRGGQLGRDRVGAARVELEYRLQVPSQVLEDLRRGEVRVARDAEVDRRLAAVGAPQQREVRRAVRLSTQKAELHDTSMAPDRTCGGTRDRTDGFIRDPGMMRGDLPEGADACESSSSSPPRGHPTATPTSPPPRPCWKAPRPPISWCCPSWRGRSCPRRSTWSGCGGWRRGRARRWWAARTTRGRTAAW